VVSLEAWRREEAGGCCLRWFVEGMIGFACVIC
jgi:hypothetical protein